MQANQFKRASALSTPVKGVKASLRLLPRKTQTALVVHSAITLSSAVADLQQGLSPYILGSQLSADMVGQAKENMGPVLQHLFALAKALKIKVPSSGKKIKLQGETFTAALLHLHASSASMLSLVSELLDGSGLTESHEIEAERLANLAAPGGLVSQMILQAYAFTYSALKVLPSEVMEAQYQRLVERHGAAFFATKAELTVPAA